MFRKSRKLFAFTLAAAMLLANIPASAAAQKADNLCEHHSSHNETCGYILPTEACSCTHSHTDTCYGETVSEGNNEVDLECKHMCDTSCGYPGEDKGTICTFACGECAGQKIVKPPVKDSGEQMKSNSIVPSGVLNLDSVAVLSDFGHPFLGSRCVDSRGGRLIATPNVEEGVTYAWYATAVNASEMVENKEDRYYEVKSRDNEITLNDTDNTYDVQTEDLGKYIYCVVSLNGTDIVSSAFQAICAPALVGDLIIDYTTNTVYAMLDDDGGGAPATADAYGSAMVLGNDQTGSGHGKIQLIANPFSDNEIGIEEQKPVYDSTTKIMSATFSTDLKTLTGFGIGFNHDYYLGIMRNFDGKVPTHDIIPGEQAIVITLKEDGDIGLTDEYIQSIITKIRTANADKKIVLALQVTDTINLSAASMGSVAATDGLFTQTDNANLTINKALLTELNSRNGDVTITAESAAVPANTNTKAKEAIGDRPVVDLSITADRTPVTEFAGGGMVTVSIPYTLGEGEGADNLVVYYIREDGTTEATTDVSYVNGFVSFTTAHFSKFAVGYTPTATYTLTVNANGGTASGGGAYAEGAVVSISAGSRASYSFNGWTSNNGGSFANVNSSGTTFTMPAGNATVSASWSYSGGGSGNGGSTGGDSTVATPPSSDHPTAPANAATKVESKVNSSGKATATVPEKSVTDAIKEARDAAIKAGTEANGITVTVMLTTDKTASSIAVTLPQNAVAELVKAGANELRIESSTANLNLDLATLKQIQATGGGSVTISVNKVNASRLSKEAQAAMGGRPVFDFSIQSGGKAISSFGGGSISVVLPYAPAANEKPGSLYGVYVDANGKVSYLTSSSYDSTTKMLRFRTSHFSTFGIGHKADTPVFTDTTNHWARHDIDFVVARGLLNGTGSTTFGPNTGMTQGMFLTALGRLAGVDSTKYITAKFSDAVPAAYYTPYTAWAMERGITSGTGATIFSPDAAITRQELALFMHNYAKAMGYAVPRTRAAIDYSDAASIEWFARDAVKAMQMAGVMNGKNGNRFDPTGIATRAEVAATLHRYVELVIDSATAQGLDVNDSGSAMLYENGKPVKSASRTVNFATYTFNANGEAAILPTDSQKLGTYTVQKGNSFWLIARKAGCTMAKLEQLNNKSRYELIYAGQVLIVPTK